MFVFGLGHSGVRLVTAALDLSFGSWACGPASFLNGNYVCSWTWKLEHWTCYISIGLVYWKLGLQPSFILNKILCLFLNLKAGTLDLSLQHWTCLLEARPDKLCLFLDLHAETLHLSFQHWTYHSKAQLQS